MIAATTMGVNLLYAIDTAATGAAASVVRKIAMRGWEPARRLPVSQASNRPVQMW